MNFLEALYNKLRKETNDITQYIHLFYSTTRALKARKELAKAQKLKLFLQRLLKHMKEKTAQTRGLITDGNKVKGLDFNKIVVFIKGKARTCKELDLLNNLDNIANLVKDTISKPIISNRPDT